LALILNLDTTTKVCSVSLTQNGQVVALKESHDEGYTHAEKLHVFIEDIFREQKFSLQEIDAVSVAEGPGSYTGLRIGVSCVKGLCYALEKPMIAVNPLKALALQLVRTMHDLSPGAAICPMIDARRDEVFMAAYNPELDILRPVSAAIITSTYFDDWKEDEIYLTGDGATKFREWFPGTGRVRIIPLLPASAYNGILAGEHYTKKEFADVAYFEPLYGKEFQTTVSKKAL
jgi:tRNA threonylcarbamoyladenosine biosynthesis protein TsaB